DRAGERVDPVQVAAAWILRCRGLTDLAVESFTRLDLDFFSRRGLNHRRDRLVPAIVALPRLLGEAFGVVDRDALHDVPPISPPCSRLCISSFRGKHRGTRRYH